ncbi:thiamine-phosphate kinase [Derxia lacustris]|uniref:thiamine-phosphate kinase n=1 Tax=Derxia lacustris TaxID=764842 RepID=UPI000A1743CA|nr:thiamine-phosphate kinase [Derxia lacustris]
MGEFELIERLFKAPAAGLAARRPGVLLGIGDDCALLDAGPLAISTDMLVEGRHFFRDADPAALGHKALAVNLSDLAAMGAEPLGFTLALALPAERARDLPWCEALAAGMLALAAEHDCALIGGDTTAGPLTLSITVFGRVDPARALRRDGARDGDDIWISGVLGDAAFALERRYAGRPASAAADLRLDRPTPRVALGRALAGVASAAIDLSDGLAGDLAHVLAASRLGARVDLDRLPLSAELLALSPGQRHRLALAGGDDYELCFTAAPAQREAVLAASRASATPVARIGAVSATPGLVWLDAGQPVELALRGFDHFAPAL